MNKYTANKNFVSFQHKTNEKHNDNELTTDQTKELIDYIYNNLFFFHYCLLIK